MREGNKKYQKYLPSKRFIATMSAVVAVLVLVLIASFLFSGKKDFQVSGDNNGLSVQNQTVNDLIEKDSDHDGIADWEEALWGTDKNKPATFAGVPDATYIANKKKELNLSDSVDEARLTETEKFAREFFTSYSALKASGDIDANTINNFSNALGQKIVNPALGDTYTAADVKLDKSGAGKPSAEEAYYQKMQKLFKTYQSAGIGEELDIVNSGLAANGGTANIDPQNKLPGIGAAYQSFAKSIMELSVPENLAAYHLAIANSAYNTGVSVVNMRQITNDPLVGLEGISQYQKYSADLVKAVADLETALAQ